MSSLVQLLNFSVGSAELMKSTLVIFDSGQLISTSLHLPKQLNSTERHTVPMNSTIKHLECHVVVLIHTHCNLSYLGPVRELVAIKSSCIVVLFRGLMIYFHLVSYFV